MAVETYHDRNGWHNRTTGKNQYGTFDTKKEAAKAGRQTAINQKTEHVIKNLDGTIGKKNSYGNDPHPPKG